jgi:hypothetical protein
MNLRACYNDFKSKSESAVSQLWRYAEFETSVGLRREVSFVGGSVIVQETPPNNELSVIVIHTSETRVYKHAAYFLAFVADSFLQGEVQQLTVRTFGQAYQAFIGVNTFSVEAVVATGTLEHEDRFGTRSEREKSHVNAVIIKRKTHEQR